jgi:Tol biopolymer transport system component
MALSSGTRLGPYQITDTIGAGGMGEVYKARDPRLGRDVAIKVIPALFAADPARLHRFEQEARAAAALNHPNIVVLYDIGIREPSSGSGQATTSYIVSELLEGDTLRGRVESGALSVRKAVDYAAQIARGLAAAHEMGVVHRDLKPENVFVTADGRVKILDFGLAKLTERQPAAAGVSMLPTAPPDTLPGVVLGTVGYMAPEQVRGVVVDHRCDIFAFGAVLYEMLSGHRAFHGDTTAETMTAILHQDPAGLPVAQRHIPAGLARIVDRCLEKDPRDRFQSAGDLAFALNALSGQTESTEVVAVSVAATTRGRLSWFVATAALIAAVALSIPAMKYLREMPAQAPEMRLVVTTPHSDDPLSVAISPDGRQLAFVATVEGKTRLWIRPLDSTDARPLTGTDGASFPFWSWDNKALGFFAGGRLKRIDVAGGPAQVLANAVNPRGGTWNAHGVIIFQPEGGNNPLLRMPATGGTPSAVLPLAAGQTMNRFPWFLPDGRHFLYFAAGGSEGRGGVWIAALDAPNGRRLLDSDTAAIYASAGYLLFARQGTLVAHRFDLDLLQLAGEPFTLAEQVTADLVPRAAAISASTTGMVVYRNATGTNARQLVWFDRTGEQSVALGAPDSTMANVELSPNGTHVAVDRDVGGNRDIWLIETRRGISTRLSTDTASEMKPVWSPDGLSVVFNSNRSNVSYSIHRKLASGAGADDRLSPATANSFGPADWSPDGQFLLYERYTPQTGRDLWALPMIGDREAFSVVTTQFEERDGQFSPDGRWIAFVSDKSGRHEVYVQPFAGAGGASQVSTTGGLQPRWRRDGKENELFYIAPDGQLMATLLTVARDAQVIEAGTPTALFATHLAGGTVPRTNGHQYAVGPDGQRFLINVETQEGSPAPITVLLNWPGGK